MSDRVLDSPSADGERVGQEFSVVERHQDMGLGGAGLSTREQGSGLCQMLTRSTTRAGEDEVTVNAHNDPASHRTGIT